MFNQILAIDIASRITDFHDRIKTFTKQPVMVVDAPESLQRCHLDEVDAVLVSIYQPLDETSLSKMPRLGYVGVLGTSLKKIPVEYLQERGIVISNVTDYCDDETAEWVMMCILKFFREKNEPLSVWGKKLGVIGVGAVGQKIIHLAQAFSMEIFYNAATEHEEHRRLPAEFLTKEKIFATCDVISLHTPAFLIWLSQDILQQGKKNLCLINTCMGRISVNNNLEEFLKDRSDVSLIMDQIAGQSYPHCPAQIINEQAFNTVDAQRRLVNKFFMNMQR